jgi:hypothetical protein
MLQSVKKKKNGIKHLEDMTRAKIFFYLCPDREGSGEGKTW